MNIDKNQKASKHGLNRTGFRATRTVLRLLKGNDRLRQILDREEKREKEGEGEEFSSALIVPESALPTGGNKRLGPKDEISRCVYRPPEYPCPPYPLTTAPSPSAIHLLAIFGARERPNGAELVHSLSAKLLRVPPRCPWTVAPTRRTKLQRLAIGSSQIVEQRIFMQITGTSCNSAERLASLYFLAIRILRYTGFPSSLW